MFRRGEYVKAVAKLSYRSSSGLPIDAARLQYSYGNSQHIRCRLIEGAVAQYGPIYSDDYSWSHEGFRELVVERRYVWETTESGRLRLDKDCFKAQAQRYPELETLHQFSELSHAPAHSLHLASYTPYWTCTQVRFRFVGHLF